MSQAARTTGMLLLGIALACLAAAHLLPFQRERLDLQGPPTVVSATPWLRTVTADGVTDTAGWFDDSLDGGSGIALVRSAGPLLAAGAVVTAVATIFMTRGRRIMAGILGILGSCTAGTMVILLSIGLDRHFRADPAIAVSIPYSYGFYAALAGTLLALAGAVFAFLALAEESEGARRAHLPPRPAISVDNPAAFNPMTGHQPKPFTADPPPQYRDFEVTGGVKPFKADPKPEPKAPVKPAAKPAGAAPTPQGKPAGPPAPAVPAPTATKPPAAAPPAAKPAGPAGAKPAAAAGRKPDATAPPAKKETTKRA